MRVASLLGPLALSLLVSVCAWAADDDEALKIRVAAHEFDQGRRAYLAKDFVSAAAHFENAFRDMPRVESLRLAMRAHTEAGHHARAATLAELALQRYGDDVGTAELARETIAKLRDQLHRVSGTCEPACALVVDDRVVFDEPSTNPVVHLEPGVHRIAAIWGSERARQLQVEAKAGEQTSLVFHRPPPVPSVPPPYKREQPADEKEAIGEEPSGLSPVVTYVGAGLTLALAGATIWSGIDTKNNPGREAVELQCLDLGESCPAYQDGRDRQLRTNILLGTTIGVAAATGVVGLLLTNWSGRSSEAPSTGLRVVPQVAGYTSGFALGAEGRF